MTLNCKLLLVAASYALQIAAQPSLTSIEDVFYNPDGSRFRGTIEVAPGSRECSLIVAGKPYSLSSKLYCIGVTGLACGATSAEGVVSISLAPTVGAQPIGCYYSVRVAPERGQPSTQFWEVPASGPVAMEDVRLAVAPNPSARVGVGQIVGFTVCDPNTEKNHWTGTAWACVPDQGGSASGGIATDICEISIEGDPVADTQDAPGKCENAFPSSQTITAIRCRSDAAATVRPIITGGAADSLLSGTITCGPGGIAGTLQGSPTLSVGQTVTGNVISANGATYITILVVATRPS